MRHRVQKQGSEDIPVVSLDAINIASKKVKNSRAPGDYDVVTEAIKIGRALLMSMFQKPFNLYLWNQNAPTNWNNSITILFHKKGDITHLEPNRPISLLTIFINCTPDL